MAKRVETYHICDCCGLTTREVHGVAHGITATEIHGVNESVIRFDLCMGCRNRFYLAINVFMKSGELIKQETPQ